MDKALFCEIYEEQFRRVYNYISYRINNHGDTEELVAQVFLRVVERFDSFDPSRGNVECWVIGIARNTVADYRRRRRRWQLIDIEPLQDRLIGDKYRPDEIVVRDENNRELIRALHTLKERERDILSLKYAAGWSNAQIARQLRLSESNVGVILHRSLKKLRKLWEKEETPCTSWIRNLGGSA